MVVRSQSSTRRLACSIVCSSGASSLLEPSWQDTSSSACRSASFLASLCAVAARGVGARRSAMMGVSETEGLGLSVRQYPTIGTASRGCLQTLRRGQGGSLFWVLAPSPLCGGGSGWGAKAFPPPQPSPAKGGGRKNRTALAPREEARPEPRPPGYLPLPPSGFAVELLAALCWSSSSITSACSISSGLKPNGPRPLL